MSAVVRVDGARQLRRSLKAAGVSIQDLKDVNRAVAETVHSAAEPHAPRASGRLAGSERPAGTQAEAMVRAGGARLPYARPVHWGWPARNIRANPWIWDAARATENSWTGAYLAHLERIIDTIEGAPSL